MSPSLLRLSACFAATVLLALGHGGAALGAGDPAGSVPRWSPPPAVRSIDWPDASAGALAHDPAWPSSIEVGRLTLLPVNSGDQVRINGAAVYVGFASGTSETYPDAISWLGPRPPGIVRVPTWSSARFLALRADAPTRVTLEVMARSDDPLREHRLDAAVHAWLTGETDSRPEPASEAERRAFDALLALRALLDGAAPPAGPSRRTLALLLHSYWLEQRSLERRLVEPFFVAEAGVLAGGKPVPATDVEQDDTRAWSELGTRGELSVHPAGADVVSVAVRARAVGQSRVQIWSGPLLAHDLRLQIPRRAEGSARWTPARIARVAVPGDRVIRVAVLEGEARVAAEGYRATHGLLEAAAVYRASSLAAQLKPEGPDWARDWIAFRSRGGAAELERLTARVAAADRGAPTPPGALAAIAAEVLPALIGRDAFFPALSQFWTATQSLPTAPRDALRSRVLERLAAVLSEPVVFPKSIPPPEIEAGSRRGHTTLLLGALLESVVRREDGARPRALFELERAVSERAGDARLAAVAHESWSRAAPWQALAAPGAIERTIIRRPFDESQPSGMCDNQGLRGLRWWIVPAEPTAFEVLDLGGTHSALRLLPLEGGAAGGAEIAIDDQPVFVQPALGEESRAGVRPGTHRIQHKSGGAVIARIPRLGSSPCDQLVEMERWFALHGELVFALPPGDAPTVASVIVDPSSLPKAGARLEVSVNGAVVVGWVRAPASGDVEILVPPGASELRVRAEQPLLVRARARAHPTAETPLAALPERKLPELDGSLAELAKLTLRMRSSPRAEEVRELRRRRAEVLLDIGYPELGAADALRAGDPDIARRRSLPGALFLPERPEPVVPLGVAAKAPLLPLGAPRTIERALELDRLGYGGRALSELVAERLHDGTDVAALLSARLAAQTGDAALAAAIFERLARATGSGALFEAAAEQYDRLAANVPSIDATERAFVLAKLAVRAGARMDSMLARYASAVEWTAPSLSAVGVSAKNIDASAGERRSESVGSRMRRALLSTPDDARQFGGETSFNVRRWRGQTLVVESLCFNREGPEEGCSAEIVLDGAAVRCEPPPARPEPSLAVPERCPLTLGDGASVLLVRLPAGARRMGWARLEALDAVTGAPAPISWQQTLAVITTDTPIRLDLIGPSVFRVSARALGARAASLALFDRALPSASSPPSEPQRVAALDFAADERPAPDNAENAPAERVSEPQELEYVVDAPGPHQLTLLALSGRLLVRPEIAIIVSTPDPLGELTAPAEPAGTPALAASSFDTGLTSVAPRRARSPVSASAELAFEDRDLAESDSDRGDRYAQAALVLRRELLSDQLWVQAAGFARVRDGAASTGIDLAAGLAAEGARPGAFASARVVAQPAFDAVGSNATLGLRHRLELSESSSFLPELSATWRRSAALASIPEDVDGDVYSGYAVRRPWSIDAKGAVVHRPFIDTLGRHELGARFIPDAGGFDRVDARSEIDLLAGAGWMPWLALGIGASHRPSFALREHAFTRWQISPHATFWHWAGEGSRLRSDLDVTVFLDTPNPSGARAGVFASIALSYDFLLGDGLGDFRVSERPFRARLEEGGPGPEPIAPANDVYWREDEP